MSLQEVLCINNAAAMELERGSVNKAIGIFRRALLTLRDKCSLPTSLPRQTDEGEGSLVLELLPIAPNGYTQNYETDLVFRNLILLDTKGQGNSCESDKVTASAAVLYNLATSYHLSSQTEACSCKSTVEDSISKALHLYQMCFSVLGDHLPAASKPIEVLKLACVNNSAHLHSLHSNHQGVDDHANLMSHILTTSMAINGDADEDGTLVFFLMNANHFRSRKLLAPAA